MLENADQSRSLLNTNLSLDAAMLQKQGRDGGKLQARLQ
jgi:hypothetical protein